MLLAGRYRLEEPIAEGGFAQVWRGFDTELQRPVAVKLPRNDRRVPQFENFLGEARKIARLSHPGIVPVYDVCRHGDSYYIVSELIAGEDLGKRLQRGLPPVREAVRIVVAVAEALGSAHRRGIVHRDIKPANILLGADGQVCLTDFGIALDRDQAHARHEEVWGTLAYMSPEQLAGPQQQLDGRSDIYSLGVVFHELLTGSHPVAEAAKADTQQDTPWARGALSSSRGRETPKCLLRIW